MKPERAPKQYANLWERGSTGVFAVVETNSDGKHYLHYILKDHLGSWTTITDSDGAVEQELSFDAWGNLRNPETWTSPWPKTPHIFMSAYPYHPAWRYTLSYREIWGSR